MKKSQFVELLANIKATLVSFFSIVMFVALGVGLFLGIHGSARALEDAANRMFEENSFHDFEVIFPYGLSDDDIAALKKVEGVDEVTPTYITYPQQVVDDTTHTMSVRPLTEGVDGYMVKSGSLPTKKGEIAIGDRYAARHHLVIGDTITFIHDADVDDEGKSTDEDGMKYLTTDSYKIVGLVGNPNFISQLGETLGMSDKGTGIETFGCVTDDSFDPEAFQGMYPCALVRSNQMRGHETFTDEYRDLARSIKAAIMEVGEPRAEARFAEIKGEA
ncbi:MAG: ABC transporter permease, partial [Atopobiaceae bacterium]|nr:ABC transporter permease [Atopobiaceae bacterium]